MFLEQRVPTFAGIETQTILLDQQAARRRKRTMTQGFSKGLSLAALAVIAALTLIMAFAPAGSIYQG